MAGKIAGPGNNWVEIFAPLAGIIGHNYSIFLIEKRDDGKIQFGGGAGGAPAFGGALGLWLPSFWYLIIVGLIAFFGYWLCICDNNEYRFHDHDHFRTSRLDEFVPLELFYLWHLLQKSYWFGH
jgi:hypothetical protein